MSLWRDFWDKSHRIYVNERHRQVHYQQVADDIVSVLPAEAARVLDYGCGEALAADRVAMRTEHLYLFDASQDIRRRLTQRFAGNHRISVLDDDALASLPGASLDLMIVNSVVQYLTPAEMGALLSMARRLLRPGGMFVVADIIPPGAGMVADVSALLRTARPHGFLGAALIGLVATFFSDYRRLRKSIGLATYSAEEMRRRLAEAGFDVTQRHKNFGFNSRRMTFLARAPH